MPTKQVLDIQAIYEKIDKILSLLDCISEFVFTKFMTAANSGPSFCH